MRDPTAEFEAYWRDLRGDLLVPRKSAVDPAGITELLPRITILERHAADEIIYRLSGTAVAGEGASDQTGKNILDFVPAGQRQRLILACTAMVGQPCGSRVTTYFTTEEERVLERKLHYLPMSADDGEIRFLLGYYHPMDDPSQPPPLPGSNDRVVSALTRVGDAEFIDIGAGIPNKAP